MERQHVLIVDDNASLLLVLCEIFRLAGFKVSTASDGLAAIETALSIEPDIIVLDVGLPGRNGFEVCRTLRQDPKTQNLPIVLLTARAGDSDRHWGLDAGADDYLTKPFDPDRLVAKTREIVAARQMGESRNPLTQLPDLASLARQSAALSRRGEVVVGRILEFEAESVGVFRQKYGDVASAEAIRLAAACLRHAAEEAGTACAAVGHSGNASYSRFALISTPENIDSLIAQSQRLFDAQVGSLYSEADQTLGGVSVPGPDGTRVNVPFIKLAVTEDDEFETEIRDAA
jgi:DNA-binding response OmpR family regulator